MVKALAWSITIALGVASAACGSAPEPEHTRTSSSAMSVCDAPRGMVAGDWCQQLDPSDPCYCGGWAPAPPPPPPPPPVQCPPFPYCGGPFLSPDDPCYCDQGPNCPSGCGRY